MSVDSLLFVPETHEYRLLPDGRIVPSVTQILGATGVAVDFEELSSFSKRIGDAIDRKRALGQALHQDAHAFDDNDLDWSTVHPQVEPYLQAWATFREQTRVVPMTRERRIYHPTLHYAGTFDGIFTKPSGGFVLIDIKTGNPADAGAQYQLAGYLLAYQLTADALPVTDRWSVQLCPDRKVPYRVTPYTEWRDFEVWKAIVATYYAQAARRREAAQS